MLVLGLEERLLVRVAAELELVEVGVVGPDRDGDPVVVEHGRVDVAPVGADGPRHGLGEAPVARRPPELEGRVVPEVELAQR